MGIGLILIPTLSTSHFFLLDLPAFLFTLITTNKKFGFKHVFSVEVQQLPIFFKGLASSVHGPA
jgi:hypothetical protein